VLTRADLVEVGEPFLMGDLEALEGTPHTGASAEVSAEAAVDPHTADLEVQAEIHSTVVPAAEQVVEYLTEDPVVQEETHHPEVQEEVEIHSVVRAAATAGFLPQDFQKAEDSRAVEVEAEVDPHLVAEHQVHTHLASLHLPMMRRSHANRISRSTPTTSVLRIGPYGSA
jgi:hypothetical protein